MHIPLKQNKGNYNREQNKLYTLTWKRDILEQIVISLKEARAKFLVLYNDLKVLIYFPLIPLPCFIHFSSSPYLFLSPFPLLPPFPSFPPCFLGGIRVELLWLCGDAHASLPLKLFSSFLSLSPLHFFWCLSGILTPFYTFPFLSFPLFLPFLSLSPLFSLFLFFIFPFYFFQVKSPREGGGGKFWSDHHYFFELEQTQCILWHVQT